MTVYENLIEIPLRNSSSRISLGALIHFQTNISKWIEINLLTSHICGFSMIGFVKIPKCIKIPDMELTSL